MKKTKKRGDKNIKNKKKRIKIILVLTVIIILLSMRTTYAKYISVDKISSQFSIATPIFVVQGGETIKISEINNIGYYEFSIKNFDENNISEVGFLYTIEIIANADDSIQFELYSNEIPIALEDFKTPKLSISGSEKIEQNYTLKVIYDSTKGIQGKDILEEVQVKVHSEQEKI